MAKLTSFQFPCSITNCETILVLDLEIKREEYKEKSVTVYLDLTMKSQKEFDAHLKSHLPLIKRGRKFIDPKLTDAKES